MTDAVTAPVQGRPEERSGSGRGHAKLERGGCRLTEAGS